MAVAEGASDLRPLGVGDCIRETVALFGSSPAVFAAFAVLIGALCDLPRFFLIGKPLFDPTFAMPQNDALTAALIATPMLAIIVIIVPAVIGTLTCGIFVLAAYDARSGRPSNIALYSRATFGKAVPLVFLTFIVTLAMIVGLVTVVVPGLWIVGVFSVVLPVIMIEGLGFGSLGRSFSLTKGYRWPIAGLLVLVYILTDILPGLIVALMNLLVPTALAVFLSGAVDGIGAALMSISVTVVYARLIELTEGAGFADVANVFS